MFIISQFERLLCCLMVCVAVCLANDEGMFLGEHALPVRGGLAVVHGEPGLGHAKTLALTGQWLVHLVSEDADERTRMKHAVIDFMPLITVGPLTSSEEAYQLPFGPDSVNLIIQHPTKLINQDEISRVLAPQGLSLSGSSEQLTAFVEPDDDRYAPWTHFRADAYQSGVSADEAVAPSTTLRWMNQNLPAQQLRTNDGVVGYLLGSLSGVRIAKSRRDLTRYHGIEGIDAFSGVPLWRKKMSRPLVLAIETASCPTRLDLYICSLAMNNQRC